jgi:hypothetical protein
VDATNTGSLRPAADPLILAGAILALLGYLLPWFKRGASYEWSYSGWEYATVSASTGSSWTLLTFGWLLLALLGGVWARRFAGAATAAMIGTVGALIWTLAVVAASFASIGAQDSLNRFANLPFGIGLPVLVAGLGLLLVGCTRAVATHAWRASRESPR